MSEVVSSSYGGTCEVLACHVHYKHPNIHQTHNKTRDLLSGSQHKGPVFFYSKKQDIWYIEEDEFPSRATKNENQGGNKVSLLELDFGKTVGSVCGTSVELLSCWCFQRKIGCEI